MPVVWVTHDLQQAERLADEVVVLWEGHVATDEEHRRFLDQDVAQDDDAIDPTGTEP